MIIRFPQTGYELNTLAPSEDFEQKIKEVFAEFTKGTSEEYTFADKLYFLDRLRVYIHDNMDDDEIAEDVIMNHVKYELSEFGNLPDKEDFRTIEFMTECARQGFRPFYFRDKEKSSSWNDESLKTILRVIQIVVDWKHSDAT